MAKLSGVKTLDMVGGEVTKVEYNGEVYEKVGTDSPKVGDIGMIIDSWGALFNGEFYEVERVYSRSSCETYHVLDEIKHKVGKVQDEDTVFFRKQSSTKIYIQTDEPQVGGFVQFKENGLDYVADKFYEIIKTDINSIEYFRIIDDAGHDHGFTEYFENIEGYYVKFPGGISDVEDTEESPKTSGAKAGDIIEMTSDCIWGGYDKGNIFTVRVDHRGSYIFDNDGDRRNIDAVDHIEYKIVKEAEEAPKLNPKHLFAKVNRPNNEPLEGDYVEFTDIHVDYVSSGHKYAVHSDDDGDLYFFDDDGDDMSVVDPEWTVKNIYVKYSQEQADKEPKVGDKVLVVNPNITFDKYEKGDILTVSDVDSVPHAPSPNIEVEEIYLYLSKEEVIVLTPEQAGTTPQQSDETEAEVDTDVKSEFERNQEQAKVNPEGIEEGDLVLIESLAGSAACGFYEGSIYIVGNYEKRMGRAREGRIAIKDGEGNFGYIDEANVKLVAKAADLHV